MDKNVEQSDFFWRMVSTAIIWALASLLMLLGFIFLPSFGDTDIANTFFGIIGALLFFSMGFVWNWGRRDNQQAVEKTKTKAARLSQNVESEKRKRDRLDAVIQTLSDDQLMTLRERLASGEITDEQLIHMLGDDELANERY